MSGSSGNLKGRPRKTVKIDAGDLRRFKDTVIEVPTPDGTKLMTREGAVWHRLYQTAMKGGVQAQRFLLKEFEKLNERRAEIQHRLEAIVRWMDEDPKAKLTREEADFVENARRYLSGETAESAEDFIFAEDYDPGPFVEPTRAQLDSILEKLKGRKSEGNAK